MSRFLPLNAPRWLASYEAAGGRFLIVGAGAFTQAATPRAQRLANRILQKPRRRAAVHQLAAALGPASQRIEA